MHSISETTYYPPNYIDTIWQSTGKYNNFALYADILRYGRNFKERRGFKFNDVAKWLIENNKEFCNYYTDSKAHVPKSSRLANKRHRIQGCIDDLVSWGFMRTVGKIKAEKNELDIPLYESTFEGNLLSLIVDIKFFSNSNRTKELENILDIVDSLREEINSGVLSFTLDFFRRSHSNKRFQSIVSHFMNVVIPKSKVSDAKEFLAIFLGLKNCMNRILADQKSFWDALANLDNPHRKEVLFQFKSEIENYYSQHYFIEEWKMSWLNIRYLANPTIEKDIFYRTVGIPGTYWQTKRIELANDYENAIIPSICKKCESDTAFSLKVIKYLQLLAGSNSPYPSQVVSGDCMKCGDHFAGVRIMTLPFYTSPWT